MRELEQGVSLMERITATAGAGGGILTMVISFFDAHAAGIGAMCTILTVFTYMYVSICRKGSRTLNNEGRSLREEIRDLKKVIKKRKDDDADL